MHGFFYNPNKIPALVHIKFYLNWIFNLLIQIELNIGIFEQLITEGFHSSDEVGQSIFLWI